MAIKNGTKMVITTDDWFRGPDGQEYKWVFGPVQIIENEKFLGFETKGTANYIFVVGVEGNQVILAGCRVHYFAIADEFPTFAQNILDLSKPRQAGA